MLAMQRSRTTRRRKLSIAHLDSPLITHEHMQSVHVDLVMHNSFRRKQSHQCTLSELSRLLRQRLVHQHVKCIEDRRVFLKNFFAWVKEGQLHEALGCVALDGTLDLFALVEVALIADMFRIEEQGLREQLEEIGALED